MVPQRSANSSQDGSAQQGPAQTGLKDQIAAIRYLIPFMWRKDRPGFRARIVISFLAILIGQLFSVAAPLALASGINKLSADSPELAAGFAIGGFIIGYGVLRLLSTLLPQVREFLFAKVAQTAQREVAVSVFQHLHALSLRYHLERRTGGVSQLIHRGVRAIDFLFRFLIFNIGPTLIQLGFVAVAFGVRYSLSLVAIVVATVILYFWFTAVSTEWRLGFRRTMNDKDQLANTRAVDALLNYETVKYFGNETYERDRYDEAVRSYQDAAIRSQTSLAWVNFGQSLLMNVGMVAALLLVARGVATGTYGVGEMTGVSLIMMQLYQPLNILGFAYREIKQALIDMERMFALLRLTPEVRDRPGAGTLTVRGAHVRFADVHFAYDAEREILRGVSFEARPGEKVALVGPSGAGKSTIARLLFRFYDVTSGAITIDGQDIAAVSQTSVRAAIGMVPQDTVLFNDTIGYNIAYGRPGVGPGEIADAARAARIDGFIDELPRGYETLVGERGLKLSGGEKQRIAIARTFLKDPPLLILDEATSALDSVTEAGILEALRAASKDRTTLVIAHRLSTVIDADRIVVIDRGRVVETGTHTELVDRGGVYARLWRQQSEGFGEALQTDMP